jgi:hypothetical protein
MLRRPLSVACLVALAVAAGCTAIRPAKSQSSPAPVSAAAVAPSPSPPSTSFLTRQGSQLEFGGAPYRVIGIDAYELATDWGHNTGCGGMVDDSTLESLFGSLPTHSLVRMWGFQGSMATNPVTHQRDWTGLDRVVAAAQRHGDLLVVSLANQPGDCDDGHWKDRAWYAGGYQNVYPGNGSTIATVSYWDWVHEIVSRYRDSTAIGMWELVNEPEATDCALGSNVSNCYGHQVCPDSGAATAAMTAFFDSVGNEIKRIDPHHLVESGVLGGAQCGWVGDGFTAAQASSGIDVVSVHDYSAQTISAEVAGRMAQARSLGKPLLLGEVGVAASDTARGCPNSLAARKDLLAAKADAFLGNGAAAVLFWDWLPSASGSCTYDIAPGDPALGVLRTQMN